MSLAPIKNHDRHELVLGTKGRFGWIFFYVVILGFSYSIVTNVRITKTVLCPCTPPRPWPTGRPQRGHSQLIYVHHYIIGEVQNTIRKKEQPKISKAELQGSGFFEISASGAPGHPGSTMQEYPGEKNQMYNYHYLARFDPPLYIMIGRGPQ